jgi:hypothetical protein
MEIFIVNLTTKSFFRSIKNEIDKGYNIKLLELLTPPDKTKCSHWFKTDKIVFCPTHLHNYVEKNYAEIYVFDYDYKDMRLRMKPLAEELIANRFHPKNFNKFVAWGFEEFEHNEF